LKAVVRFTFPVAVKENRFLIEDFDFNFGIFNPFLLKFLKHPGGSLKPLQTKQGDSTFFLPLCQALF